MEEKLVGRWVKKIKSDAWNYLKKVGEYDIIEEEDSYRYMLKEAKTYYTDSYPKLLDFFELMPIGWTPEQQSPQFIVGKWYKFTAFGVENQYGKISNIYEDSIICSCWIHGKTFTKKGSWSIVHWEKYELLEDLSEIQAWLPKNHPDKISQELSLIEQAQLKYKIGDKVKALNIFSQKDYIRSFEIIYPKDLPKELWIEGRNTNILLYRDGKWAEIIEQTSPKEQTNSIPEYVKVLTGFFCEKDQIGKIYKTTEAFPIHLEHCQKLNWKEAYLRNETQF